MKSKIFILFLLLTSFQIANAQKAKEPKPDPIDKFDSFIINEQKYYPDEIERDYVFNYTELYPEAMQELKTIYRKLILTEDQLYNIIDQNTITYYYYLDEKNEIKKVPYRLKLAKERLGHNPQYGENETALGQFVDNYNNTNFISELNETVKHTTLNAIELNQTYIADFQNFTTYTESDALNRLSQPFWYRSAFSGLQRQDNDIHLSYDYTADFFDDFTHYFNLNISNADTYPTDWIIASLVTYADGIGDWLFLRNTASADQLGVIVQVTGSSSGYYLQARESRAGSDTRVNGDYEFSENVEYYITVYKNNMNFSIFAYSDQARTNLIENVTNVIDTDMKTRYIMCPQSFDAASGAHAITGYVDYLDFGGGNQYVNNGNFTTVNLMQNLSGNGLVYFSNATIPANDEIRIQFSINGSTWINHNGLAGYDSISQGFECLDLRDINEDTIYVRQTFIDGGGDSTPRQYQGRIVSTKYIVTPAADDEYVWIAIAIILCIITYLLARYENG